MLRLFAGLSIPDHIAEKLLPLQTNLPSARWRPRENFHITLKFFGEVDHETANKLHEALSKIKFEPFEITLKGSGWFGGKKPQSVWVGVSPCESLKQLHLASVRAAKIAGLSIEQQRYMPHITIAYCRTTPSEPVVNWVSQHSLFESNPIVIDEFHLFSSHLKKGHSIYRIVSSYS